MNLNKQQIEATRLIFNGVMELQHIADKLGINVRTLLRWRETDEFKEEIESLRKDFRKATRNEFLAMQEARLQFKMERHKRIWRTIEKRAEKANPDIPGDDTGILITKTIKTKDAEITESRIDHASLRELSRLEDSIAKELGQDKTPIEEELVPEEDISCLTRDELDVMSLIHNRIAQHNPHMQGIFFRDLMKFEVERKERKMHEMLAAARSAGTSDQIGHSELKTSPAT